MGITQCKERWNMAAVEGKGSLENLERFLKLIEVAQYDSEVAQGILKRWVKGDSLFIATLSLPEFSNLPQKIPEIIQNRRLSRVDPQRSFKCLACRGEFPTTPE
jgi:hypothetical protein